MAIALKIASPVSTLITVCGALLGIHDWFSKRSREPEYSHQKYEQYPESSSLKQGLSTPAQKFVQTDEDLMEEAMDELDGWFTIHENGEIDLKVADNLVPDRKGMLYVFAARVAYEANKRESPLVSKKEVMDKLNMTEGEARVFLSKMGDFLNRDYDPQDKLYDIPPEEIKAELDRREVLEAVKYIEGDRRAPA
ncbi:hypothetical protein [Halomontanus rarus]|uniref:hypothetical protein n=1 Tax=Halomontanus rarus TaxID=3034020 RepID=UPI001A983614